MGRKLKQQDHNASIYIRLRDEDNWQIIDRLMMLPQYQTNRAKLINDALSIGLPVLLEQRFGKVIYKEEQEPTFVKTENPSDEKLAKAIDPRMTEIVSLLTEIVINTSLGKTMLCGLYNAKEMELNGGGIYPEKFSRGQYNSTPDCLSEAEIDMLKEIYRSKEDS